MTTIKLTKTSSTEWNGNGFGTSTAQWCVKGAEHIEVFKLGNNWVAKNTTQNTVVSRAWEKSDLLIKLAAKEIFGETAQ